MALNIGASEILDYVILILEKEYISLFLLLNKTKCLKEKGKYEVGVGSLKSSDELIEIYRN